MFSKLQPQHHPFQLSSTKDNRVVTTPFASAQKPNSSNDGGTTVEVVRNPTGHKKYHGYPYKCNEKMKAKSNRTIVQQQQTPPTMFSKLQPQHHPFQLSSTKDNRVVTTPSASAQKPNSSNGGGTTVEVVRNPTGHPPGSKNKQAARNHPPRCISFLA